jgi:hypothetical protein
MADNVIIPATGSGTATPEIATDDVGGAHYQRVKLDLGGDGVSAPVVDSLPVSMPTRKAMGPLGALDEAVTINTEGYAHLGIQVVASVGWDGEAVLEQSTDDGTRYSTLPWFDHASSSWKNYNAVIDPVATGELRAEASIGGSTRVRIRCSAYVAGSLDITLVAQPGSWNGVAIGDNYNTPYNNRPNSEFGGIVTPGGDSIGLAVANSIWDGSNWDLQPGDQTWGADVDVTRLPALPAGNNNIGDVDIASSVVLTTKQAASTGTLANVASSASSVTLLASNANRLGATIHNDSTQILYVKFGTTASATSYTVKMVADAYYEVPFGYTGRIDGIWASANGNARVTELT